MGAGGFFVWDLARFFPTALGTLGDDYSLFLPWLLAGVYWHAVNGWGALPGFVPSFCGGVPFLFDPQSVYLSVPQVLAFWVPPVRALLWAWIGFGFSGAAGMVALLRVVFGVSGAGSVLGGVLFLLNGFYSDRVVFGHFTYHGFMMLPWVALAVLGGRGRIGVRGAVAGLLLAYVFYSGGINVLLPMLLGIALLALAAGGRAGRSAWGASALGLGVFVALSAYKLLPALAFAAQVVRPVALRMSPDLVSLLGGLGVSLFLPQALAWIDPARLVLDRVEFEYGVGLVPLVLVAAGAWRWRRAWRWRPGVVAVWAVLLAVPVLVNWDALGLRWAVLHVPVLRSMSVMLRFWSAYVPLLCALAAVCLDRLVRSPGGRRWLAAGCVAVAVGQAAATDTGWYAEQRYDPVGVEAGWERVRDGGAVPAVTRVGDPWRGGRVMSSRNDALTEGVSAFPCYAPMFGYHMQSFPGEPLVEGPVLAARDGRLNLRNPACYVFPGANGCSPGDAFTVEQAGEAAAFAGYRPFAYAWPWWQWGAAGVSLGALAGCVGMIAFAIVRRRGL